MKVLLCTDGSEAAHEAVKFSLLLARHGDEIRLLGVVEDHADAERSIRSALETLGVELQAIGVEYDTKKRRGYAAEQILDEAAEWQAELIVIGQLGERGLTRFIMGSTATRIVQYASCSVLLVKGARPALNKILACTGGREPGLRDVEVAGQLAAQTGSEVTVLHVMSQVALTEKGYWPELDAPANDLIGLRTREGEHLAIALQTLQTLGVNCAAKVRHGLVVDEIAAETRTGNYDLLVIGAHVAHGLNRWLLDDVTAHVLEEAQVPVLVVRTPQK
jgi:nucleotide-binding universal stress UspA family protein